MDNIQQVIVNEHIEDLRREAESLRAERRMRHPTGDGDRAGGAANAPDRPARVRLGHWLIGVGMAVAGPRQRV